VDVIASAMQAPNTSVKTHPESCAPENYSVSWQTVAHGNWEQDDGAALAERSQAEADRILREHQVPPLSRSSEHELIKSWLQPKRVVLK
jgi:hypothetical protein